MEIELFVVNRDEGTEVIIFDPKSNSAVIRLGREIKFCDEALITQVKEDIESAHPYHATIKKIVSDISDGRWLIITRVQPYFLPSFATRSIDVLQASYLAPAAFGTYL